MAYLDREKGLAAVRRCKWIERGVDPVEAELLFQNKKRCAICKRTNKLHVDHCHSSGNLRGVLCQKCNMALGLLNDDVELLAKAIDYLNKPVYH